MKTKKHIVNAVCCCAMAIPITCMSLGTTIAVATESAEIQQIAVDSDNPYFHIGDDGKVYTKQSGYFYLIYYVEGDEKPYSATVGPTIAAGTTIEEVIAEAISLNESCEECRIYYDIDNYLCQSTGTSAILVYSEDNVTFHKYELIKYEEEAYDSQKFLPYCRYRIDEEATESANRNSLIYEVQTKIDTVPYDNMIDENFAITEFDKGYLSSFHCHGTAVDGSILEADIVGFDTGSTVDNFSLEFYANGTYDVQLVTSWGASWNDTIVVTDIDTSVIKVPSGKPLDYTPPELIIDFDDTPKQIGEVVPVTIKSNEPCVFIVDGERYGTSKNMLTECVFNATYSNTYSVLATDGSDNSTSAQFTVTAFDKAEESGVGSKGRNDNPINESNRSSYWKVAGNLGNVGGGDWSNTNKSASGSMPQTGEENKNGHISIVEIAVIPIFTICVVAVVFTLLHNRKKGEIINE